MFPILNESTASSAQEIFNAFLSESRPAANGDESLIKTKQMSLTSLLSTLHPDTGKWKAWNDALTCKALECIKIMARERDGCEALWTDEAVNTLSYHAALLTAPNIPVDSVHSLESMRCLANILLLEPQTRLSFVRIAGVQALGTYLQNSSLSLDAQFLTYRLIFLVTTNNIDQCNDLIAFPKMATVALDHTKSLVAKVVGSTLTSGDKVMMALGEIFNVVFNVVSAFETVEDPSQKPVLQRTTQDQIDAFQLLVYHVAQYIKAVKMPSVPLSPPLSNAIHALMNVTSPFWVELYFGRKDYSVVTRILDILEKTLALNPATPNEAETPQWDVQLPPLFILLTRMVRAEDGARKMIKDRLLPHSIDRSNHLAEGNSTTACLIRFMSSITLPHVRETVGELLFACFNDNPMDMIVYTGLGHAAGFLVQRGLLPSSLPTAADGHSSADDIDPVTGETRRDGALKAWNNMTEEEKECESERLFVLFQKLNQTGIIKAAIPDELVRSMEKRPGADSSSKDVRRG